MDDEVKDEIKIPAATLSYNNAVDFLTIKKNAFVGITDAINTFAAGVTVSPDSNAFGLSIGGSTANAGYASIPGLVSNHEPISSLGLASATSITKNAMEFGSVSSAALGHAINLYESTPLTVGAIAASLPTFNEVSVSPMLGFARDATLSVAGLYDASAVSGMATAISTNIEPWYAENIASVIDTSTLVHGGITASTAARSIVDLMGIEKISGLSLHSGLLDIATYSVLAEESLAAIRPGSLGSRLGISGAIQASLGVTCTDLAKEYSTVVSSFKADTAGYVSLNPSILNDIPEAYFLGARTLETVSGISVKNTRKEERVVEVHYENEVSLSDYLPKVHPALYQMWRGAVEAYQSDKPDRIRHFSTSMRELFTHLMQQLAPDEAVKTWTSDPSYYSAGRPTRKSRLLYICRNISNGNVDGFVQKDVEATLAFMNLFQTGVHSIDSKFSANELLTIRSKAESTLKFLLDIQFATNH